ncbi:MAG: hypothetical protein K2K33_01985, partial [Muribaculaceae bacterium]|nr:hypothetical protein [Muribaculaceae bacterium]
MPRQVRRGLLLFLFAAIFVSGRGVAQVVADTLERGVELREVVIKPRKEKYSKINTRAVDVVIRLRD